MPETTTTVECLRGLVPHEIKCRCGNGGTFAASAHDEDCPRREVDGMLAALTGPTQHEQPRGPLTGDDLQEIDGRFYREGGEVEAPPNDLIAKQSGHEQPRCQRCGDSGERVDRTGPGEYEFGDGPCPDCEKQPATPEGQGAGEDYDDPGASDDLVVSDDCVVSDDVIRESRS